MSLTNIGKEAAENSQADSGSADYERFDLTGLSYVKMHPTTAVGGTPVALRYIPGDPDENLGDRGFAGLVIDDPFLVTDDEDLEGGTIFAREGDKGDHYKVVDLNDEATKAIDDTGVDFDGNVYYGEPVDEFEEDRVVLKLTGNAGRSATCTLDVHGKGGADVVRDNNGNPVLNDNGHPTYNNALIEHYPGNDDESYTPPRYARDTQLRPDVEGKQTAVMIQRLSEIDDDYNGDAYWSTVTVRDDEDDEWTELSPTDEFEPDVGLLRATKWLEFDAHYPDDDELEALRNANNE